MMHESMSKTEFSGKRPLHVKAAALAICLLALAGAGVALAAVGFGGESDEDARETAALEAVPAKVKADGVLVEGPVLQRGDVLENVLPADELTGSYSGGYYRASFDGRIVYVDKRFVRLAGEAVPEEWTGYAAADAIIYARPDFAGDDVLTLQLNEEVTVLDSFSDLLFVRNADGFEGYLPASMIMREKAPDPAASATTSAGSSSRNSSSIGGASSSGGSPSSGSGSSSSGSSSSGDSGSPAGSGNSSGSTDGEDMVLPMSFVRSGSVSADGGSFFGVTLAYADEPSSSVDARSGETASVSEEAESSEMTGPSALVLADFTQSYVALLNRGDEVEVKVDEFFDFTGRNLRADELSTFPSQTQKQAASDTSAFSEDGQAARSEEDRLPVSDEDRDAAEQNDDLCTIIVNGQEAQLSECLLRLEAEEDYEAWGGFAMEGAVLYSSYLLTGEASALEVNAALRIVDAIDDVLVVEDQGAFFCIQASLVSTEEVLVEEAAEEADQSSAASSGAASSHRGSSASASNSSSDSAGNPSSSSSSSGSSSGSGSGSSSGSSSASSGSGGTGSSGSSSSGGDASAGEGEWTPPTL